MPRLKARDLASVVSLLLLPPLLAVVYYCIASNPTHGTSHAVHVPETKWEFGSRVSGPTYEHAFILMNHTIQPLRLVKAISSCGCTVADLPEGPILPGEQGVVGVKLNSAGRSGEYRGAILVTTDHPDFTHVELLLVGHFKNEGAAISIAPEAVILEVVEGGGSVTKRIILKRDGDEILGFKSARCDLGGVSIVDSPGVDYSQLDPLRYRELDIIASGESSAGQYKGEIVVQTDAETNPTREIPITLTVLSAVEVYPSQLVLQVQESNSGRVRLRNRLGRPISIQKVYPPGKIPGAISEENVDDSTVDIVFTVSKEIKSNSTLRDTITVDLAPEGSKPVAIPIVVFLD